MPLTNRVPGPSCKVTDEVSKIFITFSQQKQLQILADRTVEYGPLD